MDLHVLPTPNVTKNLHGAGPPLGIGRGHAKGFPELSRFSVSLGSYDMRISRRTDAVEVARAAEW